MPKCLLNILPFRLVLLSCSRRLYFHYRMQAHGAIKAAEEEALLTRHDAGARDGRRRWAMFRHADAEPPVRAAEEVVEGDLQTCLRPDEDQHPHERKVR